MSAMYPAANHQHYSSSLSPYPSASMSVSGFQGQPLEVTVVGCTKLKDTEWISRQDPYVCVEYGSNKCRTRTCKDGGRNPLFQEKFVFSIIEGLRELNVAVWNSNTITYDDFIGNGKVQLHKVLVEGFDDSVWPLHTKTGRLNYVSIYAIRCPDEFSFNKRLLLKYLNSCWRSAADIALCKCQESYNRLCSFSTTLCSTCSPSVTILCTATSISHSICTTRCNLPNLIFLSILPPYFNISNICISSSSPGICLSPSTIPINFYLSSSSISSLTSFALSSRSLSWHLSSTILREGPVQTSEKAT